MKMTIVKHPELTKLTGYFKNIEELAEKLGIDVDDLVWEQRNRNLRMYTSFKQDLAGLARKRAEVLLNHQGSAGTTEKSSIVELTIIVNKDNKN